MSMNKETSKGYYINPRHRVFWRSDQVEYSVPCSRPMVVGDRVGVCEHWGNSVLVIPKGPVKFWTGTVSRIFGRPEDPMVEIIFDDAYSKSIMFGVKEYAKFCVFLPDQKTVKQSICDHEYKDTTEIYEEWKHRNTIIQTCGRCQKTRTVIEQ